MSSYSQYNCPITVDQIELSLISRSVSEYSGLVRHIYLFKWSVLRLGKSNVMFEKKKLIEGRGQNRKLEFFKCITVKNNFNIDW